jgi:creatinine amidohydrolase
VAWASWPGFGYPDGLFTAEEIAHGIHGGAIETSIVLHLRPDLVRNTAVKDFRPNSLDMVRDYKYLAPGRRIGFGWQIQDLNPAGAAGNASQADAERGRLLVDHAAAGLVALLQDIARFPLLSLGST